MRRARARRGQSLMPSRPVTVIIVAVSSATSFSWPSFTANTSDWVRVRVRPGFTTRPRAMMRSPAAGATRLILKLGGEHAGARRHQAQRRIAGRAVGDGADRAGMDEAVLLADGGAGHHRDLDRPGRDRAQGGAEGGHELLLFEARGDAGDRVHALSLEGTRADGKWDGGDRVWMGFDLDRFASRWSNPTKILVRNPKRN